jgi:RNA ligase (TIGR02306 family)
MSTHEVRVIRIGEIEKHPNADKLGLVRIGGYTCAVALGQFKPGDLAAYIEPDYVVPDAPEYAFLGSHRRIKSKKLRGTWSQGLLMPAPAGANEGDNVMGAMRITRYEPPQPGESRPGRNGAKTGNSQAEKPHASLAGVAVYDLENLRKHANEIAEGDFVVITEKIHGCNARYAYRNGRMWVGSRTQWRKSGQQSWWDKLKTRVTRWWRKSKRPNTDLNAGNVWWRVLDTHPWIVEWCKANQDCVLFGEVFGDVQDLKYGAENGQLFFRAFDVMRDSKFVDAVTFNSELGLTAAQRAPVLYTGPYARKLAEDLALKDSVLPGAKHLSEGVVVKPLQERRGGCGRVALKLVSDRYLSRDA